MRALLRGLFLLLPALAQAEGKHAQAKESAGEAEAQPSSPRGGAPAAPGADTLGLRAAIGVTGPLAMQYVTFDMGANVDVPVLSPHTYVSPGMHLSLRTHRVALEPLADLKHAWFKPLRSFTLSPYAGGGLGLNLGFNRGSTDLGLAFRGLGGLGILLTPKAGISTQLALELGPLIAPGAALQAAFRWDMGAQFYF